MKFTLTGPHMLCKTLMDHHYKSRADLALALRRALAKQVADLDPEVLQVDEANIPGHPDEGQWAAAAINQVLDAATRILGDGRIKWVHPDCGFWMNKRSIADRKMMALVKGRDLFLGKAQQ